MIIYRCNKQRATADSLLPMSQSLTLRSAPPVATMRSTGLQRTACDSFSWASNFMRILVGLAWPR